MSLPIRKSILIGVVAVLVSAAPATAQTAQSLVFVSQETAVTPAATTFTTQPALQDGGEKSAALAGLLNGLILPGLGNFYAGNNGHGWRHLLIHVGGVGLLVIGAAAATDDILSDGTVDEGSFAVGYAGLAVVGINWIWSIFSGVGDANAANERMAFTGPRLRSLTFASPTVRELVPQTNNRVGLELGSFSF